jgi:drug/metabolite transporter (DMT)-like permease
MPEWYPLAVAALVLTGAQRFLYKVSAAQGCSTPLTTFSFMGTVAGLSGILYLASPFPVRDPAWLASIALANSAAFFTATMAHIQALKSVPSSLAYPVIRMNIVLVILFSVAFLGESLSSGQWAGLALAVPAVLVLTGSQQTDPQGRRTGPDSRGLGLVLLATCAGAAASITCKYAAGSTSNLAFIGLSYLFSTLLSLTFASKMFPAERSGRNTAQAVAIGVCMGVLNLAGFYAFLRALAAGPLSVVASIMGMHFVVAVLLARAIYREPLRKPALLGICLAAVSLVLLRA